MYYVEYICYGDITYAYLEFIPWDRDKYPTIYN